MKTVFEWNIFGMWINMAGILMPTKLKLLLQRWKCWLWLQQLRYTPDWPSNFLAQGNLYFYGRALSTNIFKCFQTARTDCPTHGQADGRWSVCSSVRAFPKCNSSLNSQTAMKWCTNLKGAWQMFSCFSISNVRFQCHTGLTINNFMDLDMIRARLPGRSQLSNTSDLSC